MDSTNMTVSSHNQFPGNGWQRLGELEVPVGVAAETRLHAYLADVLAPLTLPAEFQNKVLESAQAAIAHAMQPAGEVTFGHIHISVFAPAEYSAKAATWGFFRVEKIDGATASNDHPDHIVEFYLYLEGA